MITVWGIGFRPRCCFVSEGRSNGIGGTGGSACEVNRTSGGGARRPRGVLEVRASGPSVVSYRGRSLRQQQPLDGHVGSSSSWWISNLPRLRCLLARAITQAANHTFFTFRIGGLAILLFHRFSFSFDRPVFLCRDGLLVQVDVAIRWRCDGVENGTPWL